MFLDLTALRAPKRRISGGSFVRCQLVPRCAILLCQIVPPSLGGPLEPKTSLYIVSLHRWTSEEWKVGRRSAGTRARAQNPFLLLDLYSTRSALGMGARR